MASILAGGNEPTGEHQRGNREPARGAGCRERAAYSWAGRQRSRLWLSKDKPTMLNGRIGFSPSLRSPFNLQARDEVPLIHLFRGAPDRPESVRRSSS